MVVIIGENNILQFQRTKYSFTNNFNENGTYRFNPDEWEDVEQIMSEHRARETRKSDDQMHQKMNDEINEKTESTYDDDDIEEYIVCFKIFPIFL